MVNEICEIAHCLRLPIHRHDSLLTPTPFVPIRRARSAMLSMPRAW